MSKNHKKAFLALATVLLFSQWSVTQKDIPAYNAAAPKGKLPPILSGDQLTGPSFKHPAQVASYKAAAKISKVLYQLPCYCYCDRGAGHNSLRSCFESTHGSHCATCMQEALLASEMVAKKKSVKEIRAAIIRGEHQKIDLQKIKAE